MRAPPEVQTTRSGVRCSSASSAARVTPSPTALPMQPPTKPKFITAITSGLPPIVAVP